jgi:hypothetical protein
MIKEKNAHLYKVSGVLYKRGGQIALTLDTIEETTYGRPNNVVCPCGKHFNSKKAMGTHMKRNH